MDNQHRKIKGYTELSQEQIDMMNKIKELGAEIGMLVGTMELDNEVVFAPYDSRWIAIGKTELQQGLMALTRAVTKPSFF